MDTDTAVALAFFAASIVIAAAMVLVAMTALRDAKRPPARREGESIPAPFAPDRNSPLGATDQGSTEETARATRSARPDETLR